MKNFIVVSAPSGAGKTTLCRELQKRMPGIQFSISSTTRPRRSIETDGVDYNFLTQEEFDRLVADGKLAEYELVHGYYYGTEKRVLEETIAAGTKMLFEVDVKGAMAIKKLYPESTIAVFIMPPDVNMLRQRLKNRGTDNEDRIQKRLERLSMEISFQDQFDYTVINDDIDSATKKLIEIIS